MDKAMTNDFNFSLTKDSNLDITKDYKWEPRDIRLPTKDIDIMLEYGSYWPMRYDYTRLIVLRKLVVSFNSWVKLISC